MTVLFTEGFETDGNGTRYSTSVPEFNDGSGDFFTRTDGSNVGPGYDVSGVSGSFFFAAQDTNGDGQPSTVTLEIAGIDIAGYIDLGFSGLFAEDDSSDGNEDWDTDTQVFVQARIDGGAWAPVLQFASQAPATPNTEPGLDTDFDGLADGASLTDAFTQFTAAIAGSGALLDLRVTFENLESGDEDIALDDLIITGTATSAPVTVLDEAFDDASKFTTSAGFFSDAGVSSGFDFFGISDGAGGGDFGGDPLPVGVKPYTGTTGNFLTGMDLDGEGAGLPITATWTGLDISGLTDLKFEGDFAEFFDSPGDIDPDDYIRIVASIDGGAPVTILDFRGADFSTTVNGIFRQDTDFDGTGDGTALTDALSTFMADIAGTGSTLDLSLEVSLNSGDEDFAVDNFRVTGTSGSTPTPAVIAKSGDGLAVDENGTLTDSFTLELATAPTQPVFIDVAAPDGQSLVSLDGVTFAATVQVELTDTTPVTVHVEAVDDAVDEATPHAGELAFTVASTDPDYDALVVTPLSVSIEDNDYTITKIHDVQGAGDASAMDGDEVTVEAVVTGLLMSGSTVNGFFLQEEDADADADAATSEGIFVYLPGATVSVGDKVRVTATVDEFQSLTELTNVSEIATLDTSVTLPTATLITLGLTEDYEAVEGMRVELVSGGADPLTVIENFNLDRFGQVTVSEGTQVQPTQIYDPQTQSAEVEALAEANAEGRFIIDDGNTAQNPDTHTLIDSGDGTPLTAGDPITEDGPTLRLGSEMASITGIMDERFGDYRLQADGPLEVVEGTGDRPTEVPDVGGDLQVASFNVLNFFNTLDEPGNMTGPNADQNPRGADNAEEYTRQLDKLVNAILQLDAEVIGLQELENNGFGTDSAIAALVDALNAELGADVYSFVDPGTGFVGSDAITTGIIYKHDEVTLTGASVLVYEESSADETFAAAEAIQTAIGSTIVEDFDRNRPTVAATFTDADGSEFTVAVNHFKSKGDSGLEDLAEAAIAAGAPLDLLIALIQDPNYDQGDGQGFWNQVRTDAALELAEWLETNPTGAGSTDNLVVLGDLNAYAQEDPVQALIEAGFTDLAQALIGPDAYSYVFDGQQGTLDYGLVSEGLLDNVTGAAEWHIAADEPDLLSYDSSFNDPAFYNDDAFAASDHDPMLIGLTLDDPTVQTRYEFVSNRGGNKDKIKYYEDGEKLDVARIDGPQKIINLHEDGLYIDGFDGMPGKDWLTIDKNGLGVWSKKGDATHNGKIHKTDRDMLDDEESIVFHLTDKKHIGDALEVEFEFMKVKGAGEVTLIFRDDGEVVDQVDLTIVDNMISYDLVGDMSFDEVEIEVGESTKVQISAVEFERLATEDSFAYV